MKAPAHTHCDVCGLPPVDRQKYPLQQIDDEWVCSRCTGRNEIPRVKPEEPVK